MGIAVSIFPRQADSIHQLPYLAFQFFFWADLVDHQRFRNDVLHAHTRVQRRKWILEDHLNISPQSAQLLLTHLSQVLSLKENASLRRGQKTNDAVSASGLSTARFSYDPEGFSFFETKTDPIYCFQNFFIFMKATAHRKVDF